LLNLPSPGVEVESVLEMLFKRARYAKWALFGLFVGVSCFLTLSLVILVSMIFPTPVQVALVVGIFTLGWCSMVLGLWFEVLELWDSFRGITLEYAIFKNNQNSSSDVPSLRISRQNSIINRALPNGSAACARHTGNE
jgi:cellulose synthase/poly-beta-1,6-N-acetylglucosamine synthase-like glycosyltransferase